MGRATSGADPTSPETDDDRAAGARTIGMVASSTRDRLDVAVIGAGPAGVIAALRAAGLGARTALITRDSLGGMAANDGPVPVRTLAQAARLIRETRQLPRYGITTGEPSLDYPRLLDRVDEVIGDVRAHSSLREDLKTSGVTVHEHAGTVRFIDPHVIESENAGRLGSEQLIICTGGRSRPLQLPGFELTCTHSDAWGLSSVPQSMLVIGAGATGVQLASIFNAFGSRVTLFEAAPRILMSEDDDVATAVGAALQAAGVRVYQDGGRIERFEPSPHGVRLIRSRNGDRGHIDATLAVIAVGWIANTAELNLAAAGVRTNERGYIDVNPQLRTTAPHIYAAGDVTGHVMVVHEAVREAYLAATNAVLGSTSAVPAEVSPLGSFTDPEYASIGLTETTARTTREVVVATQRFDSVPRPIIDGRPAGFCKLIVDRHRHTILGCHIVGERAVELVQLAAIAMAAEMTVDRLALVPFSFPTYANALGRAAVRAARELDLPQGRAEEAHVADRVGVA